MKFDYSYQRYPSARQVVYGKAMVATSQPLAAQAGLDMIKQGGNAIDAAIATAAMLTVTEPTSNGLGGDAFALVWTRGKLHGLNSSGFAPESISSQKLLELGYTQMPKHGLIPVTVPGIPAAWAALSEKFGKLPLKTVLTPAIRTAREGYAVHSTAARLWAESFREYQAYAKKDEFHGWFETFAPKGRAPFAGEIWKSEDLARSLEKIADTNGEAFYRGELAEKIDQFSKKHHGFIRKEDLAKFYPEWVEPISVTYKGYEICEIPPNGHGITALMALNILKQLEIGAKDCPDTYHKMMEAMKLAFTDAQEYVADPHFMTCTPKDLLNESFAKQRANLIGDRAIVPSFGKPQSGGTVYLCTADTEGNMVSFIESNYCGFGSGIVIPGTGISLHNRGYNFYLKPGHANCIEGGKKSYHTIIPGFLKKDGMPVGPFGVMGGFMQPQGHFQVITNTIDYHMNPQDALDAPRWMWTGGMHFDVEQSFPSHILHELQEKGHDITVNTDSSVFGRGQIIWRTEEDGILCGGCESRCDGYIAVL
ncbi:MAG: gamma-glutamyltransferase family protein [Clostridiales bacterium]|nr:gamma-glutamyltransferase family protein [Clostridiales bacterium]